MEFGHQSAKSAFLGSVSDEDLIRRYCAEPPDDQAGEQLFSRCIPRLQSTIRKMVYAKSSLCPEWHSKDAFIQDALSIANEHLFRGIRTFDFKSEFGHWLGKVAKNAALDVRRQLVGRGKGPRPRPEPIETVAGREYAISNPDFRSKYWVDPSSLVRDREVREIARQVLTLHLERSPDDRESPDAIAAYWLEERPVKEIARTLQCSERSVWRLFAHDYPELQELATEQFRITRFDDL